MRKYRYIWFIDGIMTRKGMDKANYYYMCAEDLEKESGIKVLFPLYKFNYYIYKLHSLCKKIDAKILNKRLLEKLWYPLYFKDDKNDKRPICFMISGYYVRVEYLRYLRKKYPDAKIVKIYRDKYDLWRELNKDYTDKDMKELFDAQFSYDIGDSEKYQMIHFDEIASKNKVERDKNYPLYDVFFAGVVRDRLEKLISVYDYLTANGIKCWFYLTKLGNRQKIEREGITYAKNNMSYKEMLYHTVNSKVVLEVNQKNADGFTSRFLESVMYNKKLLTDNKFILQHKYYNPEYIQCFTNAEEIDIDFIKKDVNVDFNYQGEFSPTHLINLIDNTLQKMDEGYGTKHKNK